MSDFKLPSLQEEFAALGYGDAVSEMVQNTRQLNPVVETPDEDADELAELRVIRGGRYLKKGTHKTTRKDVTATDLNRASIERKPKRAQTRRNSKLWRLSSRGKAIMRARANVPLVTRVSKGGRFRTVTKGGLKMAGMDRVFNMIEDVTNILEGIEGQETHPEDVIESFANIALISDILRESFETFAEEAEDVEFVDLAEDFLSLSEASATIAESLLDSVERGTLDEDVDGEALEESLGEMMDVLVNGLDIFNALSEDEDTYEEDTYEEGDCSCDDKDKGDDKDDDKGGSSFFKKKSDKYKQMKEKMGKK